MKAPGHCRMGHRRRANARVRSRHRRNGDRRERSTTTTTTSRLQPLPGSRPGCPSTGVKQARSKCLDALSSWSSQASLHPACFTGCSALNLTPHPRDSACSCRSKAGSGTTRSTGGAGSHQLVVPRWESSRGHPLSCSSPLSLAFPDSLAGSFSNSTAAAEQVRPRDDSGRAGPCSGASDTSGGFSAPAIAAGRASTSSSASNLPRRRPCGEGRLLLYHFLISTSTHSLILLLFTPFMKDTSFRFIIPPTRVAVGTRKPLEDFPIACEHERKDRAQENDW